MKCPKCAAQLLVVKNDYFCLQCGELLDGSSVKGELVELLQLETTTEPVLQRAILDASDEPVKFAEATANPMPTTPLARPAVPGSTPEHVILATSELGLHEVLSLTAKAETMPAAAVPAVPILPAKVKPPHKDDLHHPVAAAVAPKAPAVAPAAAVPAVSIVAESAKVVPSPAPSAEYKSLVQLKHPQAEHHHWTHNLALVSVTLGILALANVAVGWYFQDKFYPGVAVAGKQIGGTSLASASERIGTIQTLDYVDFVVGSTSYHAKAADLGVEVDTASLIDRAKRIGHDSPFPMMGLYQSLKGESVAAAYTVQDKIFEAKVAQIAAEQSHVPTSANVMVLGSNIVVISDKPGQQVDAVKLAVGIKSAIRTQAKVVIDVTKLDPTVKLDAYKADIDAVQARLSMTASIKLKTRTVSVPATEIAKWVGFGDAGSGAHVYADRIAAYVGTLGSGFDRAATVTALSAAVQSGQNIGYVANTKKTTALPNSAVTVVKPIQLQYCIASKGAKDANLTTLATKLSSTYADPRGWSLGSAVQYDQSASGCNYTVWIAAPNEMDTFSTACHGQSTCRVGNNLVINEDHWKTAPTDWIGTLDTYQYELINHETGHWLGFDHLACAKGATAPIQATSVLIWGCSPNWWSVAPELQDLKVLAGF